MNQGEGEKVRPRQSADSRNYPQGFFLHWINSTRHFEDDLCVSSAWQINSASLLDA